jgi:hypothetical protein
MSFGIDDTGIEDIAETTQIIFPHPPIISDRFIEDGLSKTHAISVRGTVQVVQWPFDQDDRLLKLFVRQLTEANMNTLMTLRNMVGLMNVKIKAGVSDTILCAFASEAMQTRWKSMTASDGHPESKADGSAIPAVFKIYEAFITLTRME